MANPAEQLDLPALFFASFFWANKRKKVKELFNGTDAITGSFSNLSYIQPIKNF